MARDKCRARTWPGLARRRRRVCGSGGVSGPVQDLERCMSDESWKGTPSRKSGMMIVGGLLLDTEARRGRIR